MIRKPKDKDFVETAERLLFCVIGYLHPPDAYTVYLKYRPKAEGRWERNGTRYHRMLQVYSAAQMQTSSDWLRQKYPQYIRHCQVRRIDLPLIPRDQVLRYYLPEARLYEVLGAPRDPLENKVNQLVTELADVSGVPVSRFGVSGSILLNIHNPKFSDIDLLIFGADSARKIHDMIEQLYHEDVLQAYTEQEIRAWRQRQSQTLGIPNTYTKQLVWPQWQRGHIKGTPYSLHPTRTDAEIINKYGKEYFSAMDSIELTATITDDQESLFTPARYEISDTTIHDGPTNIPSITEIISFEGIFAGCVQNGDQVRVRGTLEAVEDINHNTIRHRVVIGTFTSRGWLIPIDHSSADNT